LIDRERRYDYTNTRRQPNNQIHMKNLRQYGQPPYSTAVIHGGPGAAGEMAPLARELAARRGVGILEPFQTALSLDGQAAELQAVLEQNGDLPVTLIGFSWGAWLAFIVAARYPALVKKLILVGSGPFEEKYAAGIEETRLSRLGEAERQEARSLLEVLNNPEAGDKKEAFARFGALFSKADAYDPLDDEAERLDYRFDIFQQVWPEAAKLRRSGELLQPGRRIACPVVAIHGDHDPHPAEGVQIPLSATLKNFRFILLNHCGHKPWIERQARHAFFQRLADELPPPLTPSTLKGNRPRCRPSPRCPRWAGCARHPR
jgi:pimeloyl-ACP methyl ester carboxylesterase